MFCSDEGIKNRFICHDYKIKGKIRWKKMGDIELGKCASKISKESSFHSEDWLRIFQLSNWFIFNEFSFHFSYSFVNIHRLDSSDLMICIQTQMILHLYYRLIDSKSEKSFIFCNPWCWFFNYRISSRVFYRFLQYFLIFFELIFRVSSIPKVLTIN